MDNANLNDTLNDLVGNIRNAFLGSIENVVINAACKELIQNWNDHCEKDDRIDEREELKNWAELAKEDLHIYE